MREKINFNPVSSLLCGSASASAASDGAGEAASSSGSGRVGYIRVATFSKQTAENARSAIQKLKSEGADRCGIHGALLPLNSHAYLMLATMASRTVLCLLPGHVFLTQVADHEFLEPSTGSATLSGQKGNVCVRLVEL